MNKNVERFGQKLWKQFIKGYLFGSQFFFDILIQKHAEFSHHHFTRLNRKHYCINFDCRLASNQVVHV
jgi:hypothetical protein